jgi:PAS domain S-box-containing protein
MIVTGTYNSYLVALSVLVACLASYSALDLGEHVGAARGLTRQAWLGAAAITMGGGIWSMHFIGMLAFVMPIPMSYDIGLTILSLAVAIVVTGGAFYIISRQAKSPLPLTLAGIFMGLGIVAMHYTGMAAMRGHAELDYDILFVALSVVIAIGASTAALWLAFQTTDPWQKLAAALVMGLAISGMHYTGMEAAIFTAHGSTPEAAANTRLDQTNLALVVAGVTFVVLTFASIASLSQQKRAEEALRESEERWRAVFENNPTMYFMLDTAGTIVDVNPFGAEKLGYTVDELVGHPVLSVFNEADQDAAQKGLAACFEHLGQTMVWELRKRRKDGTMLWVRETARAMLIKHRPVALIVCEDVSERMRAEYLARQVFERSPDRISIVGRDYLYQRVNPAFERRYGVPTETFVGRHVAEFLGWEGFETTAKAYYARCFAGEDVSFAEWFNLALGRRYLVVSYTPLRPTSDEVEAALVIVRDLTEHMLASEGLREAQTELAHANRLTTMGQLTASIAHEVNQPIAATITNAQAALRWIDALPPDLEEARQAITRIVNDGLRAGDVIHRIRTLIKKVPARIDRIDINDIIHDVVTLTRNELSNNGVSLQTRLAQGLPPIQGDRVQLQQVILNLIINAIEAMSSMSNGARELSISTGIDTSSGALVAVRDSGPGLDPASLNRLFDAFYTTKSSGMGMGLSICRSIIEAHEGRIWAEANSPQGAAFQFILPAAGRAVANAGQTLADVPKSA